MKHLAWFIIALTGGAITTPAAVPAADYTFTTIDVPEAIETQALGINESGQVVGFFVAPSHDQLGFLYSSGTYYIIDVPFPHKQFPSEEAATGINAVDQIIGYYRDNQSADISAVHGFIYYSNGAFSSFGATFTGTSNTFPYGINGLGDIVGVYQISTSGSHGFLYDGVKFTSVDVPFVGAFNTAAIGINNSGQISGFYQDAISNHGYLKNGSTFTPVNVPFVGAFDTVVGGLNDHGDVVGTYDYNISGTPFHGFVFDKRGFTSIDFPSASSTAAEGLNNRGQIAGYYVDAAGGLHGFLADPVEPFAGTPGTPNCYGQSVSALARQYGGLSGAAAALGYSEVSVLQNAILTFCDG